MNQRDSSGLPLRAIIMVLLFLGVVFLLVGFQSMGSDSDSDSDSASSSVVSTVTPTSSATTSARPAARAEVRVFNVSEVAGAAEGVANRLREGGWTVAETGNLAVPGVPATTVYFGEAPGERESADEVGKLLAAPVEPRLPALAEQPPGVVVLVTG